MHISLFLSMFVRLCSEIIEENPAVLTQFTKNLSSQDVLDFVVLQFRNRLSVEACQEAESTKARSSYEESVDYQHLNIGFFFDSKA